MPPHTPEKQLEGLTTWFKGKTSSGEPFSVEGAAHFLAGMRELGRGIKALRLIVDGYAQKCREVETLKLRVAVLELREAERLGIVEPRTFPPKPNAKFKRIPIQ